jgi:hypothetical protein
MDRIAYVLILLVSFGLKVHSLNKRGMVYGFDKVSLGHYGNTFPEVFKILNVAYRLNRQPTSHGHHALMPLIALDWKFLWIIQTEALA